MWLTGIQKEVNDLRQQFLTHCQEDDKRHEQHVHDVSNIMQSQTRHETMLNDFKSFIEYRLTNIQTDLTKIAAATSPVAILGYLGTIATVTIGFLTLINWLHGK